MRRRRRSRAVLLDTGHFAEAGCAAAAVHFGFSHREWKEEKKYSGGTADGIYAYGGRRWGDVLMLDNQSRLNIRPEDGKEKQEHIREGSRRRRQIEIKGALELKRRRYRYGRIPNHNGQSGRRNKSF